MPVARRSLDQRGVVLIVSLLLLVVISVLAVTSLRNAASAESVAGNVRTTELATEAAEVALRFCEASVLTIIGSANPPTTALTIPPAPTIPPTPVIWGESSPGALPRWQDLKKNWDDPASIAFPLDLAQVNQTGLPATTTTTYLRPPECLIEVLQAAGMAANAISSTSSFVITARGFGPEVEAANGARSRPKGTEIWLQSHVQIK